MNMPQESWYSDAGAQKEIVIRFVIKLAVILLALWIIFTFVFGISRISGESMYPRLADGDLTVYYRLEGDYQIGDVVTFKEGGIRCFGRIVAQGGDEVSFDAVGQLIVNGNIQQEEIFYRMEEVNSVLELPYTVEEDSYYVLCDFRPIEADSRTYGTISGKDIDGKVITILRRRGI